MTRTRTVFRCQECAASSPRWVGRCPGCGGWNSLVEEREEPPRRGPQRVGRQGCEAVPIGQVDRAVGGAVPTGLAELDRVLGGGFVPGSVTLLGGEPGIGKSTLLLQAMASLARSGRRCLLVSAEESPQQVRLRAERLETFSPELWLASESDLSVVTAQVDDLRPAHLVVDSIQTVADPDLSSAPGSVGQVRECAHRLVGLAKQRGISTVLVGHVTKDGSLAGPRVLEHMVDTVLSFEGERHHALRLLRAVKHRFGPTGELGLFEMADGGLAAVPDPGRLFLSDRRSATPGSVVVPVLEGHRPLLVELQALVVPRTLAFSRRWAQGVDAGRLDLLLAVLQRRAGVGLSEHDVYASAVGGVRVLEPGADLALALAVASAHLDRPLPDDLVACGEVGLGGEVRQVSQTPRRLAEAARLGFGRALVPPSAPAPPAGMAALPVATLAAALRACGLDGPTGGGAGRAGVAAAARGRGTREVP